MNLRCSAIVNPGSIASSRTTSARASSRPDGHWRRFSSGSRRQRAAGRGKRRPAHFCACPGSAGPLRATRRAVCLREMADADRTPLQNQLRSLVLQLDASDRAERGNRAWVDNRSRSNGGRVREKIADCSGLPATGRIHQSRRKRNPTKKQLQRSRSVKFLESVMLIKPIGQGLYLGIHSSGESEVFYIALTIDNLSQSGPFARGVNFILPK